MRIARTARGWARLDGELSHRLDAPPWLGGRETGETLLAAALEAPVAPSKIICIGRNYRAHAEELGHAVPTEPLLFLKPPSSLLAPGGVIELPPESARVDFEGEVAVVIGRRGRRIREADAAAYVFGITCANDVTARDLQQRDVQFTRAKGFDTFCPIGPWIETEPPPLDALELVTRVDGEVRQRARTDRMLFSIAHLVAYASGVMTLEPGDVILTGTPEGVGPLTGGQQVEVEIAGVGVLANRVAASVVA
ncbi:MAG: fumarylacetoacetate hydrolase family protein [Sandaracinaceae bacterium]|nr:fumarylacetoacetate hydrolase family protein [Sandaracinaceae bacterium]